MKRELAKECIGVVQLMALPLQISSTEHSGFWRSLEERLVNGDQYDISGFLKEENPENIVKDEQGRICSISEYGGYGAETMEELIKEICQDIFSILAIFEKKNN